jgi:hypothetical protein
MNIQGSNINNFKSGILTTGVNSLNLSFVLLRDNEIALFVADSANFEIDNNTTSNNSQGRQNGVFTDACIVASTVE